MILNFLLLAGFTNLEEKRWLSHLSDNGPSGILESRFIMKILVDQLEASVSKPALISNIFTIPQFCAKTRMGTIENPMKITHA